MMSAKQLERIAVDAHRRGVSWADFWQQHGDDVRRAEPWDKQRFRRLVERLLCLVVSGDNDGMMAAGDQETEPWLADDQPSPSDSETQARCLLTFGDGVGGAQ